MVQDREELHTYIQTLAELTGVVGSAHGNVGGSVHGHVGESVHVHVRSLAWWCRARHRHTCVRVRVRTRPFVYVSGCVPCVLYACGCDRLRSKPPQETRIAPQHIYTRILK